MEGTDGNTYFKSRDDLELWIKATQEDTHTSFVVEQERKQLKNDGKF